MFRHVLALSLLTLACSDAADSANGNTEGGGSSGADTALDRPTLDQGTLPTGGSIPSGNGGDGGAGGAQPAGGGAETLDAGPQFIDLGPAEPECFDEDCGPGRVCYQGACIEGSRCDAESPCPGGRLCVDGVCIADPSSTGGLVAEPDQLFFSYAELGAPLRFFTTLTNKGDAVLNITAMNVVGSPLFILPEPLPLPFRLVPEQHVELPVELTPDDLMPEQAVLQISTDQPGAPPVEVRLQSDHKETGGETPCLRVAPARADFGAVRRGDVGHRNVDLISCGRASVTVLRIDRGQGFLGALSEHFDIANRPVLPAVIPPGGHISLDLTYAPGRAGLESGFWDVRSNDPATPQARIDVTALAAAPELEDVGLHIRVSWDTDLTDVDTHVLAPNGQMWSCNGDCYFSNPNPNWGDPNRWEDDPFLDVDDVDGFGPENVNIQEPANGTYRVVIHYWDTHGGNPPNTTVEVLSFNRPVASYGPVRLDDVDDNWDVVDIDWPGVVVHDLGQNVQQRNRGALCGGFGP